MSTNHRHPLILPELRAAALAGGLALLLLLSSAGARQWQADSDGQAALRLPLNTASAEELSAIPGIGPKKAAQIVDYRNRVNLFTRIEELDAIPGFGPQTIESIRPYVRID